MLKVRVAHQLRGQQPAMNKHRVILSTVLLVLFLGLLTSQFAQGTPTRPEKADQARRQVAIGLLRTINTAEVTYHDTNRQFVMWQILLSEHPKYFDKFLAIRGLQQSNLDFADAPEILPGWNLRLNVHPDGQGYDVLLRDMTDEKCGYAALTDESGVIRQSNAIDCEI